MREKALLKNAGLFLTNNQKSTLEALQTLSSDIINISKPHTGTDRKKK